MADVFTKKKRSAVMGKIRSRGNLSTELRLIALMRGCRIHGWRRNEAVFGKPDFVFRKERVAVFVDGCFWHGCPLHYKAPATAAEFWKKKIAGNRTRDRKTNRILRERGWRIVRLWEHELGKPPAIGRAIAKIQAQLLAGRQFGRRRPFRKGKLEG